MNGCGSSTKLGKAPRRFARASGSHRTPDAKQLGPTFRWDGQGYFDGAGVRGGRYARGDDPLAPPPPASSALPSASPGRCGLAWVIATSASTTANTRAV